MIWTSLLSGALRIVKAVPLWVWLVAAFAAWGAFQKSSATRATKAAERAAASAQLHAAASEAERKARDLEARLAEQSRKAADAYNAQVTAARRSAAAARTELDRVRDAIATASSFCPAASGAAPAGSADGAANLRQVLRECVGTVQTLAEAADTDAAKLMGLQEYVRATKP